MKNILKNQLDKINDSNITTVLDKLKKYSQSTAEIILDKEFINFIKDDNKEDITKLIEIIKDLNDIIQAITKAEGITDFLEEFIETINEIIKYINGDIINFENNEKINQNILNTKNNVSDNNINNKSDEDKNINKLEKNFFWILIRIY